jgi:hypothetical protein
MNFGEKISFILEECKNHLNGKDFQAICSCVVGKQAKHAVKAFCKYLVEKQITIPKQLSNHIKDVVVDLGLDPQKTWENIVIKDEVTHEEYRLSIGKNPMEIFADIHSIWHEVRPKLLHGGDEDIDEFISVGEDELAIESIYSVLRSEKIAVSQHLVNKILSVLYYLNISHPGTVFLNIRDTSSDENVPLIKNSRNLARDIRDIYLEVKDKMNPAAITLAVDFLSQEEEDLALDVICATLVRDKIPISVELWKKIQNVFVMLTQNRETWTGFIVTTPPPKDGGF